MKWFESRIGQRAAKRSAGVAPDVNLRNPSCAGACPHSTKRIIVLKNQFKKEINKCGIDPHLMASWQQPLWRYHTLVTLGNNGLTCFCEISISRCDICGQWGFSMRSTLTDLDVLPRVYLFLRGGNFTSHSQKQVRAMTIGRHAQYWLWSYWFDRVNTKISGDSCRVSYDYGVHVSASTFLPSHSWKAPVLHFHRNQTSDFPI